MEQRQSYIPTENMESTLNLETVQKDVQLEIQELENVEVNKQSEEDEPQESLPLELRSEGLVKIYGKRTVVNNVTFNVRQGEIVGLLGPNGAGKTTSFYMTTGLVIPNSGHIFIGNEEITKLPVYQRARRGIGYLAQEASVVRKMSVEDNISSVLEMTGKPRD